eukprot:1157512-Pelagomonas_calceolata.AAC.1
MDTCLTLLVNFQGYACDPPPFVLAGMTDAIKVAVRVRPLSKQERENGHSFAWNVQANCISPVDSRDSRYTLDHVFGPNWTTHRIYEATTQPLLHKVISGFNSTVFAYGQTSSGKTYTMRGTPEDAGLIPLAVNEIFALIESCQDREFLLRVSYMEVGGKHLDAASSWVLDALQSKVGKALASSLFLHACSWT